MSRSCFLLRDEPQRLSYIVYCIVLLVDLNLFALWQKMYMADPVNVASFQRIQRSSRMSSSSRHVLILLLAASFAFAAVSGASSRQVRDSS